jgi:hypothetical protein
MDDAEIKMKEPKLEKIIRGVRVEPVRWESKLHKKANKLLQRIEALKERGAPGQTESRRLTKRVSKILQALPIQRRIDGKQS